MNNDEEDCMGTYEYHNDECCKCERKMSLQSNE